MDFRRTDINTAAPRQAAGSILIIYTGGTLGMSYDQKGVLIPFDFNLILKEIPSLTTFDLNLTVFSFTEPVDSSDIGLRHWKIIGQILQEQYDQYDGFVILHGTDTMAYSASALSFMLQGIRKPVVFTGAQLPIASRRTDGRENLIAALEIASARKDGEAIVQEVCIYFGETLLRGNRSKKIQSDLFDAFESRNYPELASVGITIDYRPEYLFRTGLPDLVYFENLAENISSLILHPSITESEIRAILNQENLAGVVMLTYGTGNAPTSKWFLDALRDSIDRGVRIMNVTQCNGGKVVQGKYRTSQALLEMGVIGGNDITMEAAITKMMYVVGLEKNNDRITSLLSTPICGEMR